MDDSLQEWKRYLLSLRGMCKGGCVEKTHSSLKRLVQLSLDIRNRWVQSAIFRRGQSAEFNSLSYRREITEEDISTVASILDFPSAKATPTSLLGVQTEALKFLRNLCAELPGNQARIMQVIYIQSRAGRLKNWQNRTLFLALWPSGYSALNQLETSHYNQLKRAGAFSYT